MNTLNRTHTPEEHEEIATAQHDAIANADAYLNNVELASYSELIEQRDELLTALSEIVANDPYKQSSAGVIARAAINKATGEAKELKPPTGYTAEELEHDNPYNQWMQKL